MGHRAASSVGELVRGYSGASCVNRRLPDGAVVQLGDVRDAARHLAVVGIVRRDGGGWSPGPVSPVDAPVEPHHESWFWAARRRRMGRS